MTAADLRAAFDNFYCDKMLRAWRNRSPVTQGHWKQRAHALLGTDASYADVRRLAAALYVACGELCDPPDWTFRPQSWPAAYWECLANRLPGFIEYLPEKALSRGEYEQRRQMWRMSEAPPGLRTLDE